MYNWLQQWSKSGAQALTVLKTLKNISKVLIGFLIGMKGILYKFKELILGLIVTIIIFLVLFRGLKRI